MGTWHGVDGDLETDLFRLDGGTDGIAEIDLGDLLFGVGENGTVLALAFDLG